jgi:hypothetical protein
MAGAWLLLAFVQIELIYQRLLRAYRVAVECLRCKKLELAFRTGGESRNFTHILQDN